MVDDDGAAGRQIDLPRVGRFDLVLNLKARKERYVVAVALDPVDIGRHHGGHEVLRLLEDVVRVDEDFADVGLEIVAEGADYEVALRVDEKGAAVGVGRVLDGFPELQQVIEIPLQFFQAAANCRRAGD